MKKSIKPPGPIDPAVVLPTTVEKEDRLDYLLITERERALLLEIQVHRLEISKLAAQQVTVLRGKELISVKLQQKYSMAATDTFEPTTGLITRSVEQTKKSE